MYHVHMKMTIDNIPGYAVMVTVTVDDICLVEAGKRYIDFFQFDSNYKGNSVLLGFTREERKALCTRIYARVKARDCFSYSRKACCKGQKVCWIKVQASYIGESNGLPLYLATVADITEDALTIMHLEESVHALRKANEELESIFNTVVDGVAKVSCSEGYPVLFANESFYQMIGYTHEQFQMECKGRLSDLSVSDFSLSETGIMDEGRENKTEGAGEAGGNGVLRWHYQCRDGKRRWNQVEYFNSGQRNGDAPVLYILFTDISMIVEREKELDRKIYFQSLIDHHSPASTLIRSAIDLRPLYVSGNAVSHSGYTQEEIYKFSSGQKHQIVYPQDNRDYMVPITEKRETYDYNKEFRVKKRDGTYYWYYEMTRLEQPKGEEPLYISTFMNITEQKKSQEYARIREEEYRIVVKDSGKMVYRYNIKDKKLDIPVEAEAFSDLMSVCESVSQNVIRAGLVAAESEQDLKEFCDGVYNGLPHGRVKVKCRADKEEYRWYEAQFTTVYDNDQQPASVIITVEDITVQQQKERELKLLKQEQEILEIIKAHTDRRLFRYDISSRQGFAGNETRKEFAVSGILNDMPYDMIALGLIAEDSIKDYEQMFHDIHCGNRSGQAIIRMKNSSLGWQHYIQDYTTIFDSEGNPSYAVISYQDIQEQYISGMARAMVQEAFMTLEPNQYSLIGGILMDNRVEDVRGNLFEVKKNIWENGDMSEIMEWISMNWICESDREDWKKFHNQHWLNYMYESGKRQMTRWYGIVNRKGIQQIKEQINLFKVPYTMNLYVCCISRVIQMEPAEKEGIDICWDQPEDEPVEVVPAGGSTGKQKKIFIRTFGYFDIFIDDKAIYFPSKKGKELLAILVDRRGGICSSEEIVSILWENKPMDKSTSSRYRQTVLRLKGILDRAGIGDILVSKKGGRCIDTSKVTCDLYEYLNGNRKYYEMFNCLYMTNYSWGEDTLAVLATLKENMDK